MQKHSRKTGVPFRPRSMSIQMAVYLCTRCTRHSVTVHISMKTGKEKEKRRGEREKIDS
jgi:hypothetical protein